MIDRELMQRAINMFGIPLNDKEQKVILKSIETGKHGKASGWLDNGMVKQSYYNVSLQKAVLDLLDRVETLEKKLGNQ